MFFFLLSFGFTRRKSKLVLAIIIQMKITIIIIIQKVTIVNCHTLIKLLISYVKLYKLSRIFTYKINIKLFDDNNNLLKDNPQT